MKLTMNHKMIISVNKKITQVTNESGMNACRRFVEILSKYERNKNRYKRFIDDCSTISFTENAEDGFECKHIFKGSIASEYIEYQL